MEDSEPISHTQFYSLQERPSDQGGGSSGFGAQRQAFVAPIATAIPQIYQGKATYVPTDITQSNATPSHSQPFTDFELLETLGVVATLYSPHQALTATRSRVADGDAPLVITIAPTSTPDQPFLNRLSRLHHTTSVVTYCPVVGSLLLDLHTPVGVVTLPLMPGVQVEVAAGFVRAVRTDSHNVARLILLSESIEGDNEATQRGGMAALLPASPPPTVGSGGGEDEAAVHPVRAAQLRVERAYIAREAAGAEEAKVEDTSGGERAAERASGDAPAPTAEEGEAKSETPSAGAEAPASAIAQYVASDGQPPTGGL